MAELALVEAVTLALARAMEEDDRVLVLGEDVGVNGGVFRATDGLHARFGGEPLVERDGQEKGVLPVEPDRAAPGEEGREQGDEEHVEPAGGDAEGEGDEA